MIIDYDNDNDLVAADKSDRGIGACGNNVDKDDTNNNYNNDDDHVSADESESSMGARGNNKLLKNYVTNDSYDN